MVNLITVSLYLFLLILPGWTLATYFIKKDSQTFIKEELNNLLEASKKFSISLKNLILLLIHSTFTDHSSDTNTSEPDISHEDEQALSIDGPANENKAPRFEEPLQIDNDTALSSFSPEVVAVIHEEEEKVA